MAKDQRTVASDATIDLNRLSAFVRVVDAGSFTAAAAALGLKKSSLSRAVARLEEELDVVLLHRTTRKLTLTDAGREYFERVREALASVEDATATVQELGHHPRGIVRVTAAPDFAIVSKAVAEFVKRYPMIRVEFIISSHAVDLVGQGIDIAIRAGKLSDSTLVARKIISTSLALFASPSYLKRRGKPKVLGDLTHHDMLVYRPKPGPNPMRLTGPHGDETVDTSWIIGADDMGYLHRAALEGAGIALVPQMMALAEHSRGHLVRVLPEYSVSGGAVYAVSPVSRHQVARVKLLRDFLVEVLLRELGELSAT